jgi:PAS domain-containing protein
MARFLTKDKIDDFTMPSPDATSAIRALHENEQCLRLIADSSIPDAVISTDNRGTITFANEAVRAVNKQEVTRFG